MNSNVKSLAKCKSFAEFINVVRFQCRSKPLSYAELGRICGIKSRAYVREIALGQKKPSLETVQKIARGLSLPSDLQKFLLLLSELEVSLPSFKKSITHEISKIRRKILEDIKINRDDADQFYILSNASIVYAALGSLNDGSDLGVIVKKTQLSKTEVANTLAQLEQKNFVKYKNGRYYPLNIHLSFFEMVPGGSFHKFYLHRVKQLYQRANFHYKSDSEYFWEATFSVNIKDIPKLTKELKQLLSNFVEYSENSDGDTVRSVTVGLINPK